jgi:hypothetical protein
VDNFRKAVDNPATMGAAAGAGRKVPPQHAKLSVTL